MFAPTTPANILRHNGAEIVNPTIGTMVMTGDRVALNLSYQNDQGATVYVHFIDGDVNDGPATGTVQQDKHRYFFTESHSVLHFQRRNPLSFKYHLPLWDGTVDHKVAAVPKDMDYDLRGSAIDDKDYVIIGARTTPMMIDALTPPDPPVRLWKIKVKELEEKIPRN
ncbi:MAG: hypothetical protein KDC98_13900 [Planctomycetes bacterium]|nr:hypothetical protein [Planctomycetota bacterium]